MDENKLPSSSELAGKEFLLRFSGSDQTIACRFLDATSLTWAVGTGLEKQPPDSESYEAIRIAPGIYFVDFVLAKTANVSVSTVLDEPAGKATVLTATLPDREKALSSFTDRLGQGVELSTIQVKIQHALINPSSSNEPFQIHPRTTELVGKRIRYVYGHDRIYEHIYLNNRFYTWHCLEGVEKGLADTEACDYFKIAPGIYLFSWREKIMPTYGLVLINLTDMRSNGKTFGLDIATGNYINFTMGALAEYITG